MENLLALVDKIQQVSPLAIFSKEVFIVQNAGMQHWLNMSLAQSRGISLNIDYALPAQYLWKLLRMLSGDDDSVNQTPFSREAMSWRIYQLLAQNNVITDQDFSDVTRYWSSDDANSDGGKIDVKRYTLASQLADLFEQYLVFRPDWISAWHKNEQVIVDSENSSNQITEKWQRKLWLMLIEQQDYDPLILIDKAMSNLESMQYLLPKRICFFGINSMAPMWLSFIHKISAFTDVHFFHLNPCFSYWGDIVTEKQAVSLLQHWTEGHQDIENNVGNPLLANFGQQGREFLALLQQYSTFNIDAFSSSEDQNIPHNQTVLECVQHDILTLADQRQHFSEVKEDDSIVITSAHSALREVQGLHDWLLHQFNDDPTLTPKDILVMCPQVEDYAPYVNAVFSSGWQDFESGIPPLPCSIADRISKDSEPLVAAFTELLTLPDSRFHVSQIMSWLRIPAMQAKFGITIDEIDKISIWLNNACIHWGIDKSHKECVLETDHVSSQYTWNYGLSRLLNGFAFSDESAIYNNQLVLPDIEGDDALLLGKLMLIIEQLQNYTRLLRLERTPSQWYDFLTGLISQLFDDTLDDSFTMLYQAISALIEYCQQAEFSDRISLPVVREFLNTHFSQPDPGRQFMVGQVTFCSMLPMRSIPFKIVAVLGLNEGEFPRQRSNLGVDLMSKTAFRLGDRSRRGDDRYLFLEAIISARQSLYLSYQGRNIKNNHVRQPSIVLKELMDYLSQGYGWNLVNDEPSDIRQLPMQPYSERNYIGKWAGFDKKWLALNPSSLDNVRPGDSCPLVIDDISDNTDGLYDDIALTTTELVRFFQHPSRYFAQRNLSLFLDGSHEIINDDEPFECDQLTNYLFKERVIEHSLAENSSDAEGNTKAQNDDLIQYAKLSGKFPDLPHTDELINKLIHDSEQLITTLRDHQVSSLTATDICVSLNNISLSARVYTANHQLVFYRSSLPKAKDFINQYVHMLIVQVWLVQNSSKALSEEYGVLSEITECHGYYFDTRAQKTVHYYYNLQNEPEAKLTYLLEVYLDGQRQPLLANGDLADKYFKSKQFDHYDFEKYWFDDSNVFSLGQDPYMRYFWSVLPQWSTVQPLIETIYFPIYSERQQVKK